MTERGGRGGLFMAEAAAARRAPRPEPRRYPMGEQKTRGSERTQSDKGAREMKSAVTLEWPGRNWRRSSQRSSSWVQ